MTLQFAEGRSDRQAADAVRARLDWRDVLRLDPDDADFDAAALCAFRGRLVAGEAGWRLFEAMLAWARTRPLREARGRRRTAATHVLAAVGARDRLAVAGETPRHAPDSLAVAAPDWLRARCRPDRGHRYGRRLEDTGSPQGQAARAAFARPVGGDGHALLAASRLPDAPAGLREVPAVATPRRVRVRQFRLDAGAVRRRAADDSPPAAVSSGSPDDADAPYARKGTTPRVGSKSHGTAACDDDMPRLVTHVATTTGAVVVAAALSPIRAALRGRDLLPAVRLVASGPRAAPPLVATREDGAIALRGPARPDDRWHARARHGFARDDCRRDRAREPATCPAGRTSSGWRQRPDPAGRPLVAVECSRKDCGSCPSRPVCCNATGRAPRRTRWMRPRAQFAALQAARRRASTTTLGET